MSRAEAFSFLEYVAALRPPSLLLSGGEPLAHPDFFEYVARASSLGLKVSLSTNGTLIDARTAEFLTEMNVGYVGVSIDGEKNMNDAFRGLTGAFEQAINGIRVLKNSGCRVGLRFTMARPLLRGLPAIMRTSEDLSVDRVCFYHFIPSGRSRDGAALVPLRAETRDALRKLFEWVDRGDAPGEALTVGNFADGILLHLYLKERGDSRAESALSLIARSGGGRSGRGIVSVRWDGTLFADQFSWRRPLGRWPDIEKISDSGAVPSEFGGRCGRCRWIALCRGNMRARAEALTGDPKGEDPGCVLEDAEIENTPEVEESRDGADRREP
jgi:MoaA/NifB/PqqE/SkfB family radical SAM enzyme